MQVSDQNRPGVQASLPDHTKTCLDYQIRSYEESYYVLKIYSVGVSKSCYLYNKTDNSWKPHSDLMSKRCYHKSALVKGALFMTGGLDGSWTTLSSTVFVYGNGTVETGPQLPEARSGHCMVTLHDGKVLIQTLRHSIRM